MVDSGLDEPSLGFVDDQPVLRSSSSPGRAQLAHAAPGATIYGLVLVRASDVPGAAKWKFDVATWEPSERSVTHPYLAPFVYAAKQSNFAPGFGAEARHELLRLEHNLLLEDRKREGILGELFNKSFLKWSRFSPGDSELFPFRIHGPIR
jgi:hypothetical protein